jgi:hypothetical protein
MSFSTEETLQGSLFKESKDMIHRRYSDFDGAAELEPYGCAQNAMQCYVKSQAVADKVRITIPSNNITKCHLTAHLA